VSARGTLGVLRAGVGGLPAGRMCPTDYRYSPTILNRAPDFAADILYVAGGLYGNLAALKKIEWLACRERQPVTIVFNGDFHWFDAEPDWFAAIEKGVARHRVIRGNVETEIARAGDIGAGCGCAYPESVDEGVVTRSNEILADLRQAARDAGMTAHLAALPMHLVANVGGTRIGIVHGDAASLAGWRFAHDALDDPAGDAWRDDARAKSAVDIFACTHTCLAWSSTSTNFSRASTSAGRKARQRAHLIMSESRADPATRRIRRWAAGASRRDGAAIHHHSGSQ
jgi:hypothetical protein